MTMLMLLVMTIPAIFNPIQGGVEGGGGGGETQLLFRCGNSQTNKMKCIYFGDFS